MTRRAIRSGGIVMGLAVAASLLGAAPVAAVTAGPTNSFDFGVFRMPMDPVDEPLAIPLTIVLDDLDPDVVLYNGTDPTTDFLLGQIGLTKPVTIGSLATKYPDAYADYKLTSVTLDTGTQFTVDATGCTGSAATSCSGTLTFDALTQGAKTDTLRTEVESIGIGGTTLVAQLANIFAGHPLVEDAIEAYLVLELHGYGSGPSLVSSIPAAGSTKIARDVRPIAVLTPPIDAYRVTTTSVTIRDLTADAPVTAAVAFDYDTSKVTITPALLLAAGHTFRVHLDGTIIRDTGMYWFETTSWDFVVSTDATAPTVTGRKPAPSATAVSRTANVVVTFGERLRGSTVTKKSVRLKDTTTGAIVAAVVTYDGATKRATLNPSATLAAKRGYQVLLGAGIRDVAGNPLTATSWTFTTGS